VNNIFVLGHTGMLGHIVHNILSSKIDCNVLTTNFRWPENEFKKVLIDFSAQKKTIVVNCIGAIPQKVDSFNINYDLPLWLEQSFNNNFGCKIIHPGTDCEIDENKYGLSKRRASDFILKNGKITKIIKTSIIGPELTGKKSLFEWFLNNKGEQVYGFDQFYWNGITTLQWANICYDMIINWNNYHILTVPSTNCISKYELLKKIKKIFNKQVNINKNSEIKVNKCLTGNLIVPSIDTQLIELKNHMNSTTL